MYCVSYVLFCVVFVFSLCSVCVCVCVSVCVSVCDVFVFLLFVKFVIVMFLVLSLLVDMFVIFLYSCPIHPILFNSIPFLRQSTNPHSSLLFLF